MDDWGKITAAELDILKEIGNIGSGNAATALALMLQKKINMAVPRAGVLPLEEIICLFGRDDEVVACINMQVEGEAPANLLLLLREQSAIKLVRVLLGGADSDLGQLGSLEESTLKEVGNILMGSFLTALATMTNRNFILSVPVLVIDMLGAVLTSAMLEGGYFGDSVLLMQTTFYEEDADRHKLERIEGYFVLVPHKGTLKLIFDALGIQL